MPISDTRFLEILDEMGREFDKRRSEQIHRALLNPPSPPVRHMEPTQADIDGAVRDSAEAEKMGVGND